MNKWNYNLQTFYSENNITYYLLGAFITDGCVYLAKKNAATVSINSRDKDWLEIINNYICIEKPIMKTGNNCYLLQYNSIELAKWLIAHECVPRKSLTVKMPNIPKEYLPDFIRGCWDGDGSLCFSKSGNNGTSYQRKAYLTSSSEQFTSEMSDVLTSLDVNNYIETRKGIIGRVIEGRKIMNDNINYRIHISNGENVYKLCKLLYQNSIIHMPRKYNIAQNIITNWECECKCLGCNIILQTDNTNRNKKYCKECMRQRMNAKQRFAYANRNAI